MTIPSGAATDGLPSSGSSATWRHEHPAADVLFTADGTSPEIVGIVEEAIGAIVDDGPTEEELVHQQAAYLRATEDDWSSRRR